MNKKKVVKEMISFGLQNEKNRQEIINSATTIISVLNNIETGKRMGKNAMDKITGGGWVSCVFCQSCEI